MGAHSEQTKTTTVSADKLSKNLSRLIEKNGVSTSELAKTLNLPYNTIHRLVNGFTSDPRLSTLKLIASYFHISIDELTGGHNTNDKTIASTNSRQITNKPNTVPLLSWSDIDDSNFLNNIDFNTWTKWQPLALVSDDGLSERSFALPSKQSMQNKFPLGTTFVIDPDQEPIDGDLVLIRMTKTGEASLKHLIIDPPVWQLQPIIANTLAIEYDNSEHSIIGIVVLTFLQRRQL